MTRSPEERELARSQEALYNLVEDIVLEMSGGPMSQNLKDSIANAREAIHYNKLLEEESVEARISRGHGAG